MKPKPRLYAADVSKMLYVKSKYRELILHEKQTSFFMFVTLLTTLVILAVMNENLVTSTVSFFVLISLTSAVAMAGLLFRIQFKIEAHNGISAGDFIFHKAVNIVRTGTVTASTFTAVAVTAQHFGYTLSIMSLFATMVFCMGLSMHVNRSRSRTSKVSKPVLHANCSNAESTMTNQSAILKEKK